MTYNGHPVYLYVGDSKAGDVNGEGLNAFGGERLVMSPAGNEIAASSSSSGGNGGY